ncbi:NAD(P)H-dependent flavin oxidoreductase [Shewanella salipaludis]|uniref:Nitronate monooxygenase n=1 Tax=Shewanella salipaludis TaxID=2723052 RepID=A0A972G8T1_9GAMM|nr:nitronate monooxygenase [Shewanella salipaludis]NMH66630.1 nitronate monooxygenase [Shewanella salipaludis]
MILQTLLGIELPIIQAPMAGVQGGALALAVANAGGLGSLPCAMLSPDALRAALDHFRAATDKPLNVNFFCHSMPEVDETRLSAWRASLASYYQEFGLDAQARGGGAQRRPFDAQTAELLSEYRPEVVSFHFGLPSLELMLQVKAWGAKVMSTATSVAEACWLEAHGVDVIIAQGLEAGGHRGHFLSDDLSEQSGIFALLPQIKAAVSVPVVAAGGICDADSVRAAMALGAAGVQVGTAYLLCPEADTSEVHRRALQSEAARHTALTSLFSGRPARGIVNRLMREFGHGPEAVPPFPLASAALAPLRAAAEAKGRGDFSPLWCGQNASGCRAIAAADLTLQLAEGLVG